MGRPKALIEIDGCSLIARTAGIAHEITPDVVLLGEPPFELPATLSTLEVLPDRFPGAGPIAGLDSLLEARPKCDCILLACDMPRLSAATLGRIIDAGAVADAIVPRTRGSDADDWRVHPCCAIFRSSARPAVSAAIGGGEYAMMRLLERLRVKFVDLSGEEAAHLDNWNAPEDVV